MLGLTAEGEYRDPIDDDDDFEDEDEDEDPDGDAADEDDEDDGSDGETWQVHLKPRASFLDFPGGTA